MIKINCPWCEEVARLPFPWPEEPQASFVCADCGTTVDFVEEQVAYDIAA